MHHTRKIAVILLAILFIIAGLTSCSPSVPESQPTEENVQPQETVKYEFSVHFIDVGEGDCAVINLPDNKRMVIDCGNGKGEYVENAKSVIKSFGASNIDYLVLTHPDIDHIGGATELINELSVGRAYLPHVVDTTLFAEFGIVKNLLKQKGTEIKISQMYDYLLGQDYLIAFLSPYPVDFPKSSYKDINTATPTEQHINDVSPIIYVEYKGVRFIFTGDAGQTQEKVVLDTLEIGLYQKFFDAKGCKINLSNVDFLKVAHHGAKDCTGDEFLNLLKPKNALISVGGNNSYGHPSSQTLARLTRSKADIKIYRTDVDGNVSVYVDVEGNTIIQTQSK